MEAETLDNITTQSFLRQGLHDLRQYEGNQPLIDGPMGAIGDTWLLLAGSCMSQGLEDNRGRTGVTEETGCKRGDVSHPIPR